MAKDYKEWFKQSDYDYETAKIMFNSGRYFYAVFMCHLSIEKALKGLYLKTIKKVSPKIHTLNYFIEKIELNPGKDFTDFIDNMDDAGIATRYPETLSQISRRYRKGNTFIILDKTKMVLSWIKEDLTKL